ncbi:hypothetical protein N7486_009488 [Penicillium sp. IBT 16267x]|nr:hypothetical protein N7486_009488 [Penicillium sp. IBT 16267x]
MGRRDRQPSFGCAVTPQWFGNHSVLNRHKRDSETQWGRSLPYPACTDVDGSWISVFGVSGLGFGYSGHGQRSRPEVAAYRKN